MSERQINDKALDIIGDYRHIDDRLLLDIWIEIIEIARCLTDAWIGM